MRPERLTISPDVEPDNVAKSIATSEMFRLALEAARAGGYAEAFALLRPFWGGVGSQPCTDRLSSEDSAELYLCAGILTSLSAHSVEEHRHGRRLLGDAARAFRALDNEERLTRCLKEIAADCLRSGHNRFARRIASAGLMYRSTLSQDTEANLHLIAAIAMWRDRKLEQALHTLELAYPLFEGLTDERTCGVFHNTLGLALEDIGLEQQVGDYIQRAVIEFTAASYYFEACGDLPFLSNVENNIGYLLSLLGQHAEAYSHLERSKALALSHGDEVKAAQIEDTRARVLCAEGRLTEAELLIEVVVEGLERIGAPVPLAEAQATRATIKDRIAALSPIRSNVIQFPAPLARLPERFVVQVSDDSLLNAGISAGDSLWVRRAPKARDGDLVFASTSDGAVLAFHYAEGEESMLVFASIDCPERRYPSADVRILGIALDR